MASDRTRVVVTGLGAITPVGADVASTWESMLAGRSGVRQLTDEWAAELPARIAAWAAVDPATLIDRVQARRLDRCEQLALVAAREAWAHAGSPDVDPERLGVVVSSGIGGVASTLAAYDTLKEKGWQRLSPFTVPMLMPNGAAGWIAIELGARAGVHTTVSACASGAEAIGYAMDMIRSGPSRCRARGRYRGGDHAAEHRGVRRDARAVDSQRRARTRVQALRQGPRRIRAGRGRRHGRCSNRSEHAASRGAAVHAVAAGVGYSSDAHHIAQPDPEGTGLKLVIGRVLADAGIEPSRIVHVNAHATSTPAGDVVEAQAIAAALGDAAPGVVVSATKSMTGHLLGGAGAVESVAAILSLRDRVAPPTINLEDPDDDAGLTISAQPQQLTPRGDGPMAVLNNSFGFGGANVALAFTGA